MLKTLNLDITIDETGNGRLITEEINGFILLVVLPESRLYQTKVTIFPEDIPELRFELPKKEGENVFRVRIDTHDKIGERAEGLDNMPVDGKLSILVNNGVPETMFPIKILYDTDKLSLRTVQEWLQHQTSETK